MTPIVFLSSTCYDLKQVRDDIAQFVENQGFEIRDSTNPTSFFPKPGLHSYGACLSEVSTCDLFVLVIGGRYGGIIPETERSITNEEYLEAFNRGVPMYTFVQKTVWDLLQIWKKQPMADFNPHVQDNRVFELIDIIRQQSRDNWVYPFETAGDIIITLRHQWARYFAHLIRINHTREIVHSSPSRQGLMAKYTDVLSSTADSFDIVGASLVTLARTPGISQCFAKLAERNVTGRILVLDAQSEGAKVRGEEEYGESNLIDELRSSKPLWYRLTKSCDSISIKSYRQNPKYFIFRTGKHFFVSFYPYNDSSVNAPTFEFDSPSSNAKFFQSQFDALWEHAEAI
jgi:hypothetical protein